MAIALITGASAGIGAATALAFAREGWDVAVGARRVEKISELAAELERAGAPRTAHGRLDVTERDSVVEFCDRVREGLGIPDVVVNNAGLARGLERVEDAAGAAWREMIDTNLYGVLHVTRHVLPWMLARGSGHVIMIGSVAGHKAYANGSVYCATKRALWSICESLRLETLGRGIRVTSVDPGAVETEFSLVRFRGDEDRARKVYQRYRPLRAEDVADCVLFAATRPAHVNVDQLRVMTIDQADPWHFHKAEPGD